MTRVHESLSLDTRLVAATRLVLSASALVVVLVFPEGEGARSAVRASALLASYTIYSAVIYVLQLASRPPAFVTEWGHWIDVAWYALLVAFTSGTYSIFFWGLFFAILVASFRFGFTSGIRTALVSAGLFSALGYLTAFAHTDLETRVFLIRPMYLLVLGYLVARWGEQDLAQRRRLDYLRDVSGAANQRLGMDRTIGIVLDRLVRLFDADGALLLMEESGVVAVRRVRRDEPEHGVAAESLPPEIWPRFAVLPSDRLVFYRQPALVRVWRTRASIAGGDSESAARVNVAACETLAITLDASAFVSAPVLQHGKSTGRLYLLSALPRTFTRSEAMFLSLALEHILPVIEHLQLLDKLASDAARDERRRIALDLHDGVLQPFIGLRLGLTALSEKLAAGDQGIAGDVRSLLEMSSDGIEQLRDNVLALRKATVRGERLLPAIRRVTERFSALTGIDVEVADSGAIQVSDHIAGETLQMIAEGLSNVRRHTAATRARVGVTSDAGRFIVRIENDGSEGDSVVSFQPRSIGERASALGGDVRVERRADGGAIVEIEVPVA